MNLFFTLLFLSITNKLVSSNSMNTGSYNLQRVSENKYSGKQSVEHFTKTSNRNKKYYGSGVESKYGSGVALKRAYSSKNDYSGIHSTRKPNSFKGSGIESKKEYSSKHSYSSKREYSSKHGYSSKSAGSGAQMYSIANIGIKSYSINFCTANQNTNKYSQKFSSKKTSTDNNFNRIYDIFAPTRRPTYALPPIYSPPMPTHKPTSFLEIPQLPITFHINQYGKLYIVVSPITSIRVTKVISKIANLDKKYITNLKFQIVNINRRILTDSFVLSYNITIPVLKTEDPKLIYDSIKNKLIDSVTNNTFNNFAHSEGVYLNISSISVEPYIVDENYPTYQPTYNPSLKPINASTVSNTANINDFNDDGHMSTSSIVIIVVSDFIFLVVATVVYFRYRKSCSDCGEQRIQIREVSSGTIPRRTTVDDIPNPLQRRLQIE